MKIAPFFNAMDEDIHWIPRNLDAPPLFFMFEMDTAMIWVVFILFGSMMNMFFLGLFLAWSVGNGYARLKEEGGSGLISKILYWYTPSEYWVSDQHPSHVREYIG